MVREVLLGETGGVENYVWLHFHKWEREKKTLKEKLPQAFMQIGWMEDDFRKLTAKVLANLDNPFKRYDFWKVSLMLCMSPSQVALF